MNRQLVSLLRILHTRGYYQRIRRITKGNRYGVCGDRSVANQVNLEHSDAANVGDTLSAPIVTWMLRARGLSLNDKVGETRHLMAVGSIIDRGVCDVTVWGSGVLNVHSVRVVIAQSGIRDFDVRAVRGPRTMEALTKAGFECPRIFGDPAILLPLMYPVKPANIRNRVGLILHHATSIDSNVYATYGLRQISTVENDYKAFVNKIVECKAVISSSLHGIIIAESYGIPAIYLWEDSAVGSQGIKFADWYESTGRTNVIAARTIEEALESEAPVIPDLEDMRASLLGAFPYDLWVS